MALKFSDVKMSNLSIVRYLTRPTKGLEDKAMKLL
jgi:hypothetical protein